MPNSPQIDFVYDDINRLTQRSDSSGTIDYVYDNNGNLTVQTQANPMMLVLNIARKFT
ncbi:MAG: YD repeat-containing protein [Psychrobacter glaciei]